MNLREKILRFYQASNDEEIAARLLDNAEVAIKTRKYKTTDFLDPYGYSIAETVAAHYDSITLTSDGGYTGAERVKVAFVSDEYLGKVNLAMRTIALKWDFRYYHLAHRDVLGALIGSGVKREKIGDIIMSSEGCFVVVDEVIADYITNNLPAIGNTPVSATIEDLSVIPAREEKTKDIKTTVASLRLDVVAAAGFGTSRTKMSTDIDSKKVKVNWKDTVNNAQTIKAGDIISIRGRGRVEVTEILGQTKKGRISIVLRRFI